MEVKLIIPRRPYRSLQRPGAGRVDGVCLSSESMAALEQLTTCSRSATIALAIRMLHVIVSDDYISLNDVARDIARAADYDLKVARHLSNRLTILGNQIYHWSRRADELEPHDSLPEWLHDENDIHVIIARLATTPPRDLGLKFTTWTLRKLKEHLAENVNVEISHETIRKGLEKRNIDWRTAGAKLKEP